MGFKESHHKTIQMTLVVAGIYGSEDQDQRRGFDGMAQENRVAGKGELFLGRGGERPGEEVQRGQVKSRANVESACGARRLQVEQREMAGSFRRGNRLATGIVFPEVEVGAHFLAGVVNKILTRFRCHQRQPTPDQTF